MASYALPGATTIPRTHSHSRSHHGHVHATHSHSPPNPSFLNPARSAIRQERSNGHGHSHSHAPAHAQSHPPLYGLSTSPEQTSLSTYRESPGQTPGRLPPVSGLDIGGWQTTATAGGKALITPTKATFEKEYEVPDAQSVVGHGGHDHDHDYHDHDHHHHDHGHGHDHNASSGEWSRFTGFLLSYTARYPWLHAVMTERDSRRIFYFMSLNFAFMAVQAFYGYVTDSLGLLSDSVHMFFDCVALAVGLFAAVASKWPPSETFPYGFGKIETLSGFANGVFLMLISVEIIFEAFERLLEGTKTQRLTELFIVSVLGLLVNLVGLFAFGHHHHGHDHGSHSHSHDHSCEGHDHDHNSDGAHDHSHHGHSHGHSHDNENLLGIYLHVMADTMGSGAVIVSTLLTQVFGWSDWDPLASSLIALLILASALPLVRSSARRLLLTVPDTVEYNLRETLSGITGLRGVAGYSVPRFWVDDRSGTEHGDSTRLLGVMHVSAVRGADLEDVQDRVRAYLAGKGIDITLQVEREGDGNCWCAAGRPLSLAGGIGKGSGAF